MDGNQKIRRPVCMAVDAGFIQYPSLPGAIKTGCTRTPGFKSRFCDEHLPRIPMHKPQYLTENDIENADSVTSKNCVPISEGQVVELLLQKRTTRSDTFYKVCVYKLPTLKVY